MVALAAILLGLLIACACLLLISVRRNLELIEQHDALADRIERSLDALDECHSRLARYSQFPVTSDEPVVREVVTDIKRARDAVAAIARRIAGNDGDDGTWMGYDQR